VYSALQKLCRRHDVLWACSGRIYDMGEPGDQLVTGIEGLNAQYFSAMLSKTIRRAKEGTANMGLPSGRNQYAYERVYKLLPNGQKILEAVVEHPGQASVVRECARRFLAGEPLTAIADDLNRRGVTPPGGARWTAQVLGALVEHPDRAESKTLAVAAAIARVQAGVAAGKSLADMLTAESRQLNADGVRAPVTWSGMTVRQILENPAYARLRVHRGHVLPDVEAVWPELISRADHLAIVDKLSASKGRTKDKKVTHFLTGWAECGVCHSPLEAAGPGHIRCRNRATRCTRQPVGEWVPDGSGPFTGVDDFVQRLIVARLSDPDCLSVFHVEERDTETAKAQREAEDLRARLAQWQEAARAGTVTPDFVGPIVAGLEADIADAERRARPRQLPAVLTDLAGRPDVAQIWAGYSLHQRREVARFMVAVRLLPTPKRSRTFDPRHVQVGFRRGDGMTLWET
jgi:hypothetical protein